MKTLVPIILLAMLVTSATGWAQAPTPVPTPADAARLAAHDVLQLPLTERPFMTYFYTFDRSKEFHGAFSYVINSCLSHSPTLYRPTVLANGWLIRIDRRELWPEEDDFKVLDAELQKLAEIDPYFHATAEVVVQGERKTKTETVTEFVEVEVKEKTGKKIRKLIPTDQGYSRVEYVDEVVTRIKKVPKQVEKQVEEVEAGEKKVITDFALHLMGKDGSEAPIQILALETASPGFEINAVPILRADWFIYIVSSSLEEDNGKYYTFRRIENSNDEKTAEELWLESLGVDYDVIKNLRSDQRTAQWHSHVTGKPRAIEYFFTSNARASVGPSGVSITRDYFVGKVNSIRHAMKNLLNYDYDGSEAMAYLPNGMMSFLLFDGDGALATFAPEKLVSDRTVPNPHSTLLQTPISCWRCHGPTDMWMDAPNNINTLTRGKYAINIFDDESSDQVPYDTVKRLKGLYAGEIDEFLRIVRNTHAKATYLATGGMSIPAVAKKIGEIYNVYRYNLITPQVACLELGWVVSENQAAEWFNKILPVMPPNSSGVRPESIAIATLRGWDDHRRVNLNRDDWEQEFADAMLRVQIEAVRNQASMRGKQPPQPTQEGLKR